MEMDLEALKEKLNQIYILNSVRLTIGNGKSYLGKKNFFTERKVKLGKKELALITDSREIGRASCRERV